MRLLSAFPPLSRRSSHSTVGEGCNPNLYPSAPNAPAVRKKLTQLTVQVGKPILALIELAMNTEYHGKASKKAEILIHDNVHLVCQFTRASKYSNNPVVADLNPASVYEPRNPCRTFRPAFESRLFVPVRTHIVLLQGIHLPLPPDPFPTTPSKPPTLNHKSSHDSLPQPVYLLTTPPKTPTPPHPSPLHPPILNIT